MWLLFFIVFVAVFCSSTYLSIQPLNQPSFFPSFLPSFLPFAFITPTGFLFIVLFTTFDTAIFRSCYGTFVCKGFLSINQWPGALSIQPKLSKIWKQRQMVQKLFRNCWISEMWTIQSKILEIPGAKLNGKKKLGYTSRGCPLFLEILENTVPFATESRRKFKPDVLVELQSAKGKLDGPFAVRPTGPSNHICAKKKMKEIS